MTTNHNPLQKFFRQPAIYIKLPSDGSYWPDGSLEIPQNRELPVYPMTAVDEISYRTPDALFNGQAVVDVLQSCVPAIKNAWYTPSIDLNSLLIAVRIASYGHDMQLESTCPHCNNTSEYELDMRVILDKVGRPNYDTTVKSQGIEVIFRPMNYQEQNQSNLAQFEQQKTISNITQSDLPEEEKIQQMTQIMKKLTELTVNALAFSIVGIRTPETLVTHPEHILEFLHNCDRETFAAIRDHAVDLRNQSEIQPLSITCSDCQKSYQQAINLDMANFFGNAS